MSRKLRHRSHHGVHSDEPDSTSDEKAPEEHEEIAVLAYQYWQERGSPLGSPEKDWLRAEEVVRRRTEAATRL